MIGSRTGETTSAFRYECKYLVEDGLVSSIRDYLRPFVRTDPFAAVVGTTYMVCSLYLDTLDLQLHRQTLQGIRNRYKLRIRSYSDDPESPVFFEIKRRVDGVIQKRRCGARRTAAELVLSRGSLDAGSAGQRAPVLEEFVTLVGVTGCRPVLRVKYLREPYESAGSDSVRVTFDSGLSHAVTPGPDLSLDGAGWRPTPTRGTILEIKFTERYPSWIGDLVRTFDLRRTSVPKYCLCMARALEEGRYHGPRAVFPPGP